MELNSIWLLDLATIHLGSYPVDIARGGFRSIPIPQQWPT